MIRQLHQYLLKTLERGENVALLIDEAQNLSNEVLEGLRMLSNMETGEAKLLQIILVGQPELEKKLNSEGLRQLKQRIGIRRQIRPLTEEESRQYIRQRLENMGGSTEDIFSPDALDLICRHSAGIFRAINIMCDNSLLIAYGRQRKTVEASIVREVLADMGMIVPRQASRSRKVYNPEPIMQTHYQISAETEQQEQTRAEPSRSFRFAFLSIVLSIVGIAGIYLGWQYFFTPSGLSKKDSPLSRGTEKSKSPAVKQKSKPSVRTSTLLEFLTKRAGVLPTEGPIKPKSVVAKEIGGREEIEVSEGETLSILVGKYYQDFNPTVMDFLLEANPDIKNIHLITVNQKLKLPDLNEESLLISSGDGTWKIHLGTFESPRFIEYFQKEKALQGKKISMSEREVSPRETWYRIIAEEFSSREEGIEAIRKMKDKKLLPVIDKRR